MKRFYQKLINFLMITDVVVLENHYKNFIQCLKETINNFKKCIK